MKSVWLRKCIAVISRLGTSRHLVAIRDGFIAIMPLVIVGSLAILINHFPSIGPFHLQDWLDSLFGKGNWKLVGNYIWDGSFAILGFLVSFTISYKLAESYRLDSLSVALISIGSYIIFVPVTMDSGLQLQWIGSQGLFVAIIIAIITTELFRLITKNSIFSIKMPKGVPSGVIKSFNALLPALFILVFMGVMQTLLKIFLDRSIFEIIYFVIQEPLQGIGDSLPAALLVAFLTHILWFFGLHGSNIIGSITEPIYIPLVEENLRFFQNGVSSYDVPNIITKTFMDSFVFMGGSGTTIALVIALLLVVKSKKKHYHKVAKVSAPASIFNINEPIVFGLPIVFNPIMFVPFILVPMALTCIAYFSMYLGLVPRTITILPWTTPPIISGYLATGGSWRGIVLQIINLTVAIMIYVPFLWISAKGTLSEGKD